MPIVPIPPLYLDQTFPKPFPRSAQTSLAFVMLYFWVEFLTPTWLVSVQSLLDMLLIPLDFLGYMNIFRILLHNSFDTNRTLKFLWEYIVMCDRIPFEWIWIMVRGGIENWWCSENNVLEVFGALHNIWHLVQNITYFLADDDIAL